MHRFFRQHCKLAVHLALIGLHFGRHFFFTQRLLQHCQDTEHLFETFLQGALHKLYCFIILLIYEEGGDK